MIQHRREHELPFWLRALARYPPPLLLSPRSAHYPSRIATDTRDAQCPTRSSREWWRRAEPVIAIALRARNDLTFVQPDCSKRQAMTAAKFHQIWIEQCEAARGIRERYGLEAAFDYAVGEKLMNFASAARDHPAFARELPRFVSEVRRLFSADEIRTHLARLEREQAERDVETRENPDEDEFPDESPAEAAERVRQFVTIKDLLRADTLGTS